MRGSCAPRAPTVPNGARWTRGEVECATGGVVVGWLAAAGRGCYYYRPLSVGEGAVQCVASLAAPRVPRDHHVRPLER